MAKRFFQNPRGQSLVEFTLSAPLLLFIFFGIIQLAYTGLEAFAVQRAAFSLAQEASLTGIKNGPNLDFELACALAPLAALHRAILATVTAARATCETSPDRKMIIVRITCPVPIWVPVIGRIFGKRMRLLPDTAESSMGRSLLSAFSLLGLPLPDLSFSETGLPYAWEASFEASVYNEGYLRAFP